MEFCATYQHILRTEAWETLMNMTALVRKHVAAKGGPTRVLSTMLADLSRLPFDQDGNRVLEIGFSDHEAVTALLDWSALQDPGKPYADLARQLRTGADDADRAVEFQSACN
jgi:hypothetical protein